MLTGKIHSQIDHIWDGFWSGGISNPLEVIEQITYLLFIKRLDIVGTHGMTNREHIQTIRSFCDVLRSPLSAQESVRG